MEFGSNKVFVDLHGDTEDIFAEEVNDGIANCAKEQADAWRATALEVSVALYFFWKPFFVSGGRFSTPPIVRAFCCCYAMHILHSRISWHAFPSQKRVPFGLLLNSDILFMFINNKLYYYNSCSRPVFRS